MFLLNRNRPLISRLLGYGYNGTIVLLTITVGFAVPLLNPVFAQTGSNKPTYSKEKRQATTIATHKKKPIRNKKSLLPKVAKPTPTNLSVMIASNYERNLNEIALAIKHGSDVNSKQPLEPGMAADTSPLMWAAVGAWPECVNLLLRNGARVNDKDHRGMTALDMAKSEAVREVLIKAGGIATKPIDRSDDEDLPLRDDSLESDEITHLSFIQGTITNATKKTYDYVEVDAVFYDSEGNQVDSEPAVTNYLASGSTWKFKVLSLKDHIVNYKIVKVIGH